MISLFRTSKKKDTDKNSNGDQLKHSDAKVTNGKDKDSSLKGPGSLNRARSTSSINNGIYKAKSGLSLTTLRSPNSDVNLGSNKALNLFSGNDSIVVSPKTSSSFIRTKPFPSDQESLDGKLINIPSFNNDNENNNNNNRMDPVLNEGVTTRNIATSNEQPVDDENVMVDILPSFQLYDALHRNIPTGNLNPDTLAFPPTYTEMSTCRTEYQTLNDVGVSEPSGNTLNNHNNNTTAQECDVLDDINQAQDVFIDKIYTLPNRHMGSVAVSINMIKDPVKPNTSVEKESMLKEYTSGDIVHGYVTISNETSQPIKFEMFYVSLEGYTSIYDEKNKRKTIKRFLRAVDLSASWSYSHMEISSGMCYSPGAIDDSDGSILGLNNDRTLSPKTKYKKYFMFKLPQLLLDTSCKHENYQHCQMPPSFGIDKYYDLGKYAYIDINPILCYGHNGVKGSPILTSDCCLPNHSINYSVEAKIVGLDKVAKSNSQNENSNLYIMKEERYNIRFIPFTIPQLTNQPHFAPLKSPEEQIYKLEAELLKKITLANDFIKKIESRERSRLIGGAEDVIKFSLDDIHGQAYTARTYLKGDDATGNLQKKLKQLSLNEKSSFLNKCKSLSSSRQVELGELQDEDEEGSRDLAKSEISYTVKKDKFKTIFSSSHSSHSSNSSSHSKNGHSNDQSGVIMMQCEIPKDKHLPYIKPSLLRKSNKLEKKNKHDQQNWESLISNLEPDSLLTHLALDLKCVQANNTNEDVTPPNIQYIISDLVVLTGTTFAPMPITLNANILKNKKKVSETAIVFTEYKNTIDKLDETFEKYSEEIKNISENELELPKPVTREDFIPKQLARDVLSLSTWRVKSDLVKEVFFKQTSSYLLSDDANNVNKQSNTRDHSLNSFNSINQSGNFAHNNRSHNIGDYRKRCLNEWVRAKPQVFKRKVHVYFQLNKEIRETLIPSFESCLSTRMYMIRISVKFENVSGLAEIDIPITLRFHE